MSDKNCIRLKLLASLLAICGALSVGAINAQQVSLDPAKGHDPVVRAFDPTKNETMVSVMPDFVMNLAVAILADSPYAQGSPSLKRGEFTLRVIWYSYPGTTPARPDKITFVFISDGRQPKYKDTPDFRVDADGSTTNGKVVYDLRDSSLGKIEVLTVPVPTDLFLRFAHAARVEFSFGKKTYKLSGVQKKDMRAFAETVP